MRLLLSFCLSLVLTATFAQELAPDLSAKNAQSEFNIQKPSEGVQAMSLGSHNAFSLVFDQVDEKLVMDAWKDHIKDHKGRTKKVKRSSELFSDDVQVAILGPNNVDIYSLIESKGEGSVISVWFDQGGGFLSSSSSSDGAEGVEFFLNEFQKKVHVARVSEELEAEEKVLKEHERALSKLLSENEKLMKQIEEWQQRIVKAEADIESNIGEQADVEKLIADQKDKVHATEVRLAKAEAQ